MSGSNVYKVLDKLEMLILKGLPVPLTPWTVVHQDKILDNLDHIRASMPAEIQEAISIIKQGEEIQTRANERAAQIISEAEQKVRVLVNESAVLQTAQLEADRLRQDSTNDANILRARAQEEADRIISQAIEEASSVREGANNYADTVLASLERDVTEIMSVVKNGRKHIAQTKAQYVASMVSGSARRHPQPQLQPEDKVIPIREGSKVLQPR